MAHAQAAAARSSAVNTPSRHIAAGHDGFLLEQAQLDPLIKRFLLKVEIERKEEAHVAGLTEQVESLKSMVAELRGSQRTGGI